MNQLTEQIEVKNKRISGVSTSVITAILVGILLLMHFKIDPPKIEEEGGVAVSLGEPDAGGPEEVPVEAFQKPAEPTFQPRTDEQTVDPDAVPVEKTPEVKKKTDAPNKESQPEIDLNKVLKNRDQGKPANSGDGDKTGAQGAKNGVPGGDPKGTGGTGGGTTANDGIPNGQKTVKHSFGNRRMIEPANSENCGEKGTVIVDVILKADGTVIPSGINPSSKSSNQCLRDLAIKLARKTRFAPSTDDKSNEGTITFKFTY